MPEFTGERERTIRIHRPLAEVFQKFIDLELRVRCMPDLERYEKIDEQTYRWIMKEENNKGVRFRPDYTVRYENNGKDEFTWKTLEGNPRSHGRGVCKAINDNETEVKYFESITAEIAVNRLLAPFIRGLVSNKIASGVDHFLEQLTPHIERG